MPRADCRMAPMHRSLPNRKRHVTARREVSSRGYIFVGYIYIGLFLQRYQLYASLFSDKKLNRPLGHLLFSEEKKRLGRVFFFFFFFNPARGPVTLH